MGKNIFFYFVSNISEIHLSFLKQPFTNKPKKYDTADNLLLKDRKRKTK